MRRQLLGWSLLGILVMTPGQPVWAWYDFGHMVVASVAYRKLEPATRARVDALLKLNPYYRVWLRQIPADASDADRGMMIFMRAATWPDDIKKDPAYKADGVEGGNKPDGPDCAQNVGYSDRRMHKYWHFCDRAFACDGSTLPALPEPNARTQIEAFRQALSSDASDELKSYDLTWLLHLVGDVHQPLHCVTRVTEGDPNGDKGGNDVTTSTADGDTRSLHSLWDGGPGDGLDVLLASQYAARLPEAKGRAARDGRTDHWVSESVKLAHGKVYKSPIACGNGPFVLTKKYEALVRSVSQQRVELAGARLATVLNHELK